MKLQTEIAIAMGVLFFGIWLGFSVCTMSHRKNAIDQQCGFYDGKTGEFRWGQP